MAFSDLQNGVDAIVQDGAGKLPDAQRDAFIQRALVERYSQDRPLEIATDVAGNGTAYLPLPASQSGPVFEEGFSTVRQLEYPIGEVPPSLVQNYEWDFYRAPGGLQLQFVAITPGLENDPVRVTWTARHLPDGSTMFAPDMNAVIDLAASYCFEALAAAYAQVGDNSIGADVVNYRTKSQEYLALAKAARKRYFGHMGIPEDAQDKNLQGPAVSIGNLQNIMGPGVERLTHRRPR